MRIALVTGDSQEDSQRKKTALMCVLIYQMTLTERERQLGMKKRTHVLTINETGTQGMSI